MALCAEHAVAVHSLPQSNYIFGHETPSSIVSQSKDIQKSAKSIPDKATSEPVAASLQHMKADGVIIGSAQDVPAHSSHNDENVSQQRPRAQSAANKMALKIVAAPYNYLTTHPGKDFRKEMIRACNFWCNIDPGELEIIENSVSMLHNASLL